MAQQRLTTQPLVAVLIALALGLSACTGSATVTQTGSNDAGGTEPTAVAITEAAPTEAASGEPTSVPTQAASPTAVPDPTSAPTPAGPAAVVLPTEAFHVDAIVGLSGDGAFAYAGPSSPWSTPASCAGDVRESLSVVDVAASLAGELTVVAAGLEQVGDVRQMIFDDDGSAAILSTCGQDEVNPQVWLQRAEIAPDGRISALSERLDLASPGVSDPYLLRWVDDDVVEVRVIIEVDPDDFETWIVERRQIAVADGQIVSAQQFDFYDDDGFDAGSELTTANGTYQAVDDPAGNLGCEGFGVAVTLQLDTGDEQRFALSQPDLIFSNIGDLTISPTGYISWTSGCEGYISAYVGRVLEDGTVADAHLIETFNQFSDTYVDFQHYQLTNDGFLHAVGQSFDPDTDELTPAFLRYDLSQDPHFVNTAEPAPQIDRDPLFEALADDSTWHVGETLAQQPACGGRTLYAQTPGGFVRAFPAGNEVDAIVDVDVSETQRVTFPDGDYVSRTVVISTECPGSYEGRRVWFGIESDTIIWGLGLDRADLGEVAEVLSVRDVLGEGSDFVESSIVQVALLDGSVADVELVRLPFDG